MKEIAGTHVYDERRRESLAIMNETAARREKTQELLEHIEKRLRELDEEKEELAKFQALDKQRKAPRLASTHRRVPLLTSHG